MNADVTAVELRTYLDTTKTDGRYTTAHLEFLMGAMSDSLERKTGRLITASGSNTTRKFTSHGRASIIIPDLRVADTVTLAGSSLAADDTFWLLPSAQDPNIYTGIQLRNFRTSSVNWYLSYPEWFDRNLDNAHWGANSSMPNDVVVTGLWGHFSTPLAWKLAIYAGAGYLVKHGDALLAGAAQTAEGAILDYSNFPIEVQSLIADWSMGEQAVVVG